MTLLKRLYFILFLLGYTEATYGADRAFTPTEPLISIDHQALLQVRESLKSGKGDRYLAFLKLVDEADKLLGIAPETVVDGDLPPSGDRHDFYAIGKLSFPNPKTSDGLPYIRKDGVTNPEADGDRYDLTRYNVTLTRINKLSLAWFMTQDEKYAKKAAELLKVWFLDPDTRMNPNLKNASALPGVYDGMPVGIIFGVVLIRLTDHVKLLALSQSWTDSENNALKKWFADYRDWLLESEMGIKEGQANNNHGSWYGAQVAAFSIFSDRIDLAQTAVGIAKKQLVQQLEADGSMPREYRRERSLHYSIYGLQAFTYLARCAEVVGDDLWKYQGEGGRGIELAMRFLYPYITYSKEWPWKNIAKGSPLGRGVVEIFQWGARAYPDQQWSPFPASIWKEVSAESSDILYWPG